MQEQASPSPKCKTLGSLLDGPLTKAQPQAQDTCPVCSAPVYQEKCKVICRSPQCLYRIIFNCSEF